MKNRQKLNVLAVVVAAVVFLSPLLFGRISDQERAALISLYNALNGDSWDNNSGWKSEPFDNDGFSQKGSESQWKGVTVSNNMVVKLEIIGRDITGSLPLDLGQLTNLKELNIYGPQLQGDIPMELGYLLNLESLTLIGNFSGPLPVELSSLTNLKKLTLDAQFSDQIPADLGKLVNLESLLLDGNFSGPIPDEIGNLTNLQSLHLTGEFSADIPIRLTQLTKLKRLTITCKADIFSTQMSGGLPMEIGNLPNLELIHVSAGLTGIIPPELGKLKKLKILHLAGNYFDGHIPVELGELSELKELTLSGNNLVGIIPMELGRLKKLELLWLNKNHLSGTIPPELGNLSKLLQLKLEGNQLTGIIPVNLSRLSSTYVLNLNYNSIYTTDPMLAEFLDKRDLGWRNTQTLYPLNIKASVSKDRIITISWTPIRYTQDTGNYTVYYSDTPGGPWLEAGSTPNKAAKSYDIPNLIPNKTYYFVVHTETLKHSQNRNHLISDYSDSTEAIIK